MSEELKDFNITDKRTMIELLNVYFSNEYNPLKDLIPDNVIDSMISILRQRDGIFYCPNMQRNDYDPEKYTVTLKSDLEYKIHCEKRWNEILEALQKEFKIYSQDVPNICKDIADRIHNNVNGCRKDVDRARNEIAKARKEICEIIAIPETSSWNTIMDCLKALRESYLENKDKDNPEDEPSYKFYKEICDALELSHSCTPYSVVDEVKTLYKQNKELLDNYDELLSLYKEKEIIHPEMNSFFQTLCEILEIDYPCDPKTIKDSIKKLKENHEELVQNYHDLSEILKRKGY